MHRYNSWSSAGLRKAPRRTDSKHIQSGSGFLARTLFYFSFFIIAAQVMFFFLCLRDSGKTAFFLFLKENVSGASMCTVVV